MVIDAKLPPQEPAPLGAPPPAYAPSPQDSPSRSALPQPQPQQYPPSAGGPPPQPPTASPQWHPGPQSTDYSDGRQYRDQMYALCARGQHDVVTSFGLCGIICAILLFPIGLIFLCIDTEKKCARCGVKLSS